MRLTRKTPLDEHLPSWLDELTPAQKWAWVGFCHQCMRRQWAVGVCRIKGIPETIGVSQQDFDTMMETAMRHGAVERVPGFDDEYRKIVYLSVKTNRVINQRRREEGRPGAVSHIDDIRRIAKTLPRGHEPSAKAAVKSALECITEANPGCDGPAVLEWLIGQYEPCGQLESPMDYMARLVSKIVDNPTIFKKSFEANRGKPVTNL